LFLLLQKKDVFDDIEKIRKSARRPKGFRAKDLIEEGRT